MAKQKIHSVYRQAIVVRTNIETFDGPPERNRTPIHSLEESCIVRYTTGGEVMIIRYLLSVPNDIAFGGIGFNVYTPKEPVFVLSKKLRSR